MNPPVQDEIMAVHDRSELAKTKLVGSKKYWKLVCSLSFIFWVISSIDINGLYPLLTCSGHGD